MKNVEFKVREHLNCEPSRKVCVSVVINKVCQYAPRYGSLKEALSDVPYMMDDLGVTNAKVDIEL